MNCRGCRQRFLPLPDLSRKIEGDSVRRVAIHGDETEKIPLPRKAFFLPNTDLMKELSHFFHSKEI